MPVNSKHKILLVEDVVALATTFGTHLENDGAEVHICHTAADALGNLVRNVYSLILLDLQLPDSDGLDFLHKIRQQGIDTNVVVVTSDASTDKAVEAMRMGARDYLVKPLTPDRLLVTVRNTLELVSLEELIRSDSKQEGFEGFIGSSHVMQAIYRTIENISHSKATVFISGESGTGKELCAEAIHRQSPRNDGPFIAINCGATGQGLPVLRTEVPCFSTRFARWISPCNPSCFASCKPARCNALAAKNSNVWMCASYAQPIKTLMLKR
jgi:DNA-binding NtrC family response regulator